MASPAVGSYAVVKSPPELIPPASPTPGGSLPLSSIDRTAAVRVTIDFIQVYTPAAGPAGMSPSEAVRYGLARALVPYYPVAGRLVDPAPGETEVLCSGDGVWFVAAKAACSLADVNVLERPLMIPRERLLPRPPAEVDPNDEIIMMQVTEFTCGGFAVGICFSHIVFDGQGAGQFLVAVGEMARGVEEPTIKPVWDRDLFPNPPMLPRGPLPSLTAFDFVTLVVDISLESINRVKDDVLADSGYKCSTFDAVTAIMWKTRSVAIDLPDDAEVRLGFAASTRHLLSDVLPCVEGYYGNCVYPVGITQSSAAMKSASIVQVVNVIRAAKEDLKTRFTDWMKGGAKDKHYFVPVDYGSVTMSDWSRVGFSEVDYGWGDTNHIIVLNDDVNLIGSAIAIRPPPPKQGIRMMLRCVEKPHMDAFQDLMLMFS